MTDNNFLGKAIHQVGLSTSPSYYSGRGATTSDLDYRHLRGIFDAIKSNKGDKAAKNFAHMVGQIEVLSATDFLIALYALADNDWAWQEKLLPKSNGVAVDSPITALCTALEHMTTKRNDSTVQIRAQFLREEGIPETREDGAPYADPYTYPRISSRSATRGRRQ